MRLCRAFFAGSDFLFRVGVPVKIPLKPKRATLFIPGLLLGLVL